MINLTPAGSYCISRTSPMPCPELADDQGWKTAGEGRLTSPLSRIMVYSSLLRPHSSHALKNKNFATYLYTSSCCSRIILLVSTVPYSEAEVYYTLSRSRKTQVRKFLVASSKQLNANWLKKKEIYCFI